MMDLELCKKVSKDLKILNYKGRIFSVLFHVKSLLIISEY